MRRLESFSNCLRGLRAVLLWSAALVLTAALARAGTVIDVKTVYFGEKRADETAMIFLDVDRVRFDAIEGGRPMSIVFRIEESDEPLCWVIDKKSNTYIEFTRKSVEQVQSNVGRARQQFDEQMKNASPERREQIKKTMDAARKPVPGELANVQFKKVASGVKLNKWTCTQYEAYEDDEKREDLWTTGEKVLGLTSSDIRVLREMGVLFSKFSTETNAFFQIGTPVGEGGFEGFPVVVVEYRDGTKSEKSEVAAVRKEKLEPAVFELPRGAAQQKIPSQP